MINLKGKTLSEAEKDLKELGLKVTEAGTEVSDTYEKVRSLIRMCRRARQ